MQHDQQAQFKVLKSAQAGLQSDFNKFKNEMTFKIKRLKEEQEDAINSLVTKEDIERVYKRFLEFAS